MNNQSKCRAVCTLCFAGFAVGMFTSLNDAIAKLSEIDGFEQAAATGSVEDVLGFIDAFPSSHLVIDLIGLVPPEVATRVCASLPEGASSLARRTCNGLQEAIDLAPAAGGSTSESPAVKKNPVQTRTAGLTTSRVNDDQGSGDKQRFLGANPTTDTSASATSSARRDGMPAGDTADDTTDGTASAAADDTTDTAEADETADADDADATAESEVDNTSTNTGNPNHGGPSVAQAAGYGERGTGGSNDGGAENGGGHH